MDPKKKLEQLDGLVADLIIGQNRLVEQVTLMSAQIQQLVEFQQQTLEFQRQTIEFQRQTMEFQRQTMEFQRQTMEFQRQTMEFQRQTMEFQRQTMEFQRQGLEFQSRMSMQLNGIHDFMRQLSGEFQEIREDNKRLNNLETRVRTLETIVLKAS